MTHSGTLDEYRRWCWTSTAPAPVVLNSPNGLPFDVAVGDFGIGELIQGYNNAFDGDGRLMIGGRPSSRAT